MKVKSKSEVAQSCPTLSDPKDYSLPGSSVHGIFQARVLEWAAIAFSNTQHCDAIIFQLKKFLKSLIKLHYHLGVEASHCSTLPHWARCSCFLSFKSGVSNLQNLMSDDPSWS